MASPAQIEANRRNATKSTGPKTEAGKARSRANAFKHGLAGTGIVCDEAVLDQLEGRVAMWRPYYDAQTEAEEWLLEQFAFTTIRLNIAQGEMLRAIGHASERASQSWDSDRIKEMERIARGFKKDPTATVRKLESSTPGCVWLMMEWQRLLDENAAGHWSETHDNRVHDLIGDRLEFRASKPWKDDRAGFIQRAMDRLSTLADVHVNSEDLLKEAAIDGVAIEPDRSVQLAKRYELTWQRRYESTRRQLEKALSNETVVAKPTPSSPPTLLPSHVQRLLGDNAILDISASSVADEPEPPSPFAPPPGTPKSAKVLTEEERQAAFALIKQRLAEAVESRRKLRELGQ
ncbi:MAG: hypothetical protein U0794_01800 [Isosphaeraceae bacterium]